MARAQGSAPPSVTRFVTGLVQDFRRLEPFDRAMTLAAQAFTSLFPLVLSTLSALDDRGADRFADRLQDAFELPPSTTSALADTRPEGNSSQLITFGALSLLIVLLSATSLSRALTRMYAKAWAVRAPGWVTGWRWIAAVLAIASVTVTLQWMQGAAGGDQLATAASLTLTLIANAVLWTWVPWVLLARQVPARLLAPGGLAMGVASVALFFASRLYMPRALAHADDMYGELGVAFTFIGWLFCVAFVLIVTTAFGSAVARRHDDKLLVQPQGTVPGAAEQRLGP